MSQQAAPASTRKILGVIFTLASIVLAVVVMVSKVDGKDFKYFVGGAIIAACLAIASLLL